MHGVDGQERGGPPGGSYAETIANPAPHDDDHGGACEQHGRTDAQFAVAEDANPDVHACVVERVVDIMQQDAASILGFEHDERAEGFVEPDGLREARHAQHKADEQQNACRKP